MNVKPVVSEYHYDSYQNLLCVIEGTKTVSLIPPSSLIKSCKLETEAYNHAVNRDQKPVFRIVLNKGQVLFIPEG